MSKRIASGMPSDPKQSLSIVRSNSQPVPMHVRSDRAEHLLSSWRPAREFREGWLTSTPQERIDKIAEVTAFYAHGKESLRGNPILLAYLEVLEDLHMELYEREHGSEVRRQAKAIIERIRRPSRR